MLKDGIFNRHLAAALATLGHTDTLIVADSGLPIPVQGIGAPLIVDLSIKAGEPKFLTVLDAILDEIVVEYATAASEIKEKNPELSAALLERFTGDKSHAKGVAPAVPPVDDQGPGQCDPCNGGGGQDGAGLNYISHEELKRRIKDAKVIVRTGEATPYANVILSSGVPF